MSYRVRSRCSAGKENVQEHRSSRFDIIQKWETQNQCNLSKLSLESNHFMPVESGFKDRILNHMDIILLKHIKHNRKIKGAFPL